MTKDEWKKRHVTEIEQFIFRDMRKYHGLTEQEVTKFVDEMVEDMWIEFQKINPQFFTDVKKVGDLEIPSFTKK